MLKRRSGKNTSEMVYFECWAGGYLAEIIAYIRKNMARLTDQIIAPHVW